MRRVLLAATCAAFLAIAAPADAANLSVGPDGAITYTGDGTATSDITIQGSAAVVVVTRLAADSDPITPGAGCTQASATVFTCNTVTRVQVVAGDGDDSVDATGLNIPATLSGGNGDDTLTGGAGADTVDGGAGGDTIGGDAGADQLNGDAGDDTLNGDAGDDSVNGDDGDDTVGGAGGADVLSGGPGIDRAFFSARASVDVSLDGVANDGAPGEGDNVLDDVEDVTLSASTGGTARVVGNANGNVLEVDGGTGTIVGGPGADTLRGGPDADTIDARDGFPDRVLCGGGVDTALVDPFDQVSPSCENVVSTVVPGGADDRPPAIAWASPAAGASFRGDVAATLTATASDDRGVAKVQFYDDDRLVCEDTVAPYTCDYEARGADVGRNTLIATAIDGDNQATSAVRVVNVTRFRPTVSLRAARSGHGFKATGTLSHAGACTGTVTVTAKAGKRTVSARRVKVSKQCTYSLAVRVAGRPRLKLTARFGGNSSTLARSSASRRVKLG